MKLDISERKKDVVTLKIFSVNSSLAARWYKTRAPKAKMYRLGTLMWINVFGTDRNDLVQAVKLSQYTPHDVTFTAHFHKRIFVSSYHVDNLLTSFSRENISSLVYHLILLILMRLESLVTSML